MSLMSSNINLISYMLRTKNDRGNGPANTNNAIDKCSGDIIKVMFQDDFLLW